MISVQRGPRAQHGALSWRRIPGRPPDLTALSARLRGEPYPWWLDSSLSDDPQGRFSFAGASPPTVVRWVRDRLEIETARSSFGDLAAGVQSVEISDPFEALRAVLPRMEDFEASEIPELPFLGGAVGYLGYELGAATESCLRVSQGPTAFADAMILFVDRFVAIDHARQRGYLLAWGFGDDSSRAMQDAQASLDQMTRRWLSELDQEASSEPEDGSVHREMRRRLEILAAQVPDAAQFSLARPEYGDAVEEIVGEIEKGNVYETNLTQKISIPFEGDPFRLYRSLRASNPAPFAAFFELPEGVIVSSSPERFLRLEADGQVESRPIKGTRRRGRNDREDADLAGELTRSEKDRAENVMIVDLVRNDLGRVCEVGSVRVEDLMAIERYAGVFQMVSSVEGRLRSDCDATDLLRASFPPGSMTGAPKIAAMQLIDQLEPVRRGVYSGALGYFDVRGGLDLSVVIRTILVEGGRAHFHVGGAIVADSTAPGEHAESLDKARPMLAALAQCEGAARPPRGPSESSISDSSKANPLECQDG
ncbi:MAG: aminodeoxychorismate synthase, component I [bacterium TMED88]|nr:aminodeoxychorismate synthase, component I [Deltaproteobacteria bacterium]OUV32577.1 MAG: aminodeoxychorismate synthase, component I [bacterium TMED88]